MIVHLVGRVLRGLLVLLTCTIMVFILIHLSGDPAELMLGFSATPQDLARFRHLEGFDQPLAVQYMTFLAGTVHGDFGHSVQQGQPALGLVLDRLPATGELSFVSLLLSVGIAIPLGVIAARHRGYLLDRTIIAAAAAGQSLPPFLLGLLLIFVFAVTLGVLPSEGRGGLSHLVLPTVTLALFFMGRYTRLMRSAMLDVLSQDYVRTARAKGLPERGVLLRHALKNALLAVVTVVGADFAVLMGGAVITEIVFGWPGIGRLVVQAIFNRDYPIVQAAVFVTAVFVVVVNMTVDFAYAYLDPRLQYQ